MDAQTGQVEPKKSLHRPPAAGKGRRKGSKNKVTRATLAAELQSKEVQRRETCQEIFSKIIGLEMPDDHATSEVELSDLRG